MTLHSACSIFEEVGVLQDRIEEDVACINVLEGDHPEDVKVLRTVCQGQFNLHAVVAGIGEDSVFQKISASRMQSKACFNYAEVSPDLSIHTLSKSLLEGGLLPVDGEYHKAKAVVLHKGRTTA